jgi:hypothetical protein
VTANKPLTESETRTFAEDWYRALDVHAPIEQLLPMLVDQELEMVFPEVTSHGHAGFRDWYDTVTRKFFDEEHTVKEVKMVSSGDDAELRVVVNWKAKIWDPPKPRSEQLNFDATQRWVVRRSDETGQPIIVTYVVEALEPCG